MTKFISWTAVILWAVLIFHLSAQVVEQSNQLSTSITKAIVEKITQVVPQAEINIKSFNHILRKNAHFFAYFVLGILVRHALRKTGIKGARCIMIALGVCILYAISDEVHQLFVPGRGGQVKDVAIDSAGASLGIGLSWIVERWHKVNANAR